MSEQVTFTITEVVEDVSLTVDQENDEITFEVTEVTEDVTISIYEAGEPEPDDFDVYISVEAAKAAGLVVGDKFYLDEGNDIGTPGTLLRILS